MCIAFAKNTTTIKISSKYQTFSEITPNLLDKTIKTTTSIAINKDIIPGILEFCIHSYFSIK